MSALPHRWRLRFEPRPPYDAGLTLHKPAGWSLFTPFEHYEDGVLWTALHVGTQLLGIRIRSTGTVAGPRLSVDVFTARPCTAARRRAIRDALALRLAIDDDLAPFYRVARRDPILRHAIAALHGMHDTMASHLFASATLAVLLQMAPLARSQQMMSCVIRGHGEVARFDDHAIHVFPTPRAVARTGVRGLSPCHLGYRAPYLVQIARRLERGDFPTLEQLLAMSPDAARDRLLELPGVGDYSAGIITPHGSFPIDVWSADVFGKLFFGREPASGARSIQRIKAEGMRRWGAFAWLAFFYVVQDLAGLSKKLDISLRLQ